MSASFPVDVEVDIENTELFPGVRRMQAQVGQQVQFDHGRAQMQILAGLEVTTKSVSARQKPSETCSSPNRRAPVLRRNRARL